MNREPVVLIVDDTESMRQALEELLYGQGYDLHFACDGPEALATASTLRPDLILLDVMMPVMDGFEVCRRLRTDPMLAEVPIVLLTALDDKASRLKGIEAGADDFISKPYSTVELRARVRTITRLNRYRSLLDERAALQKANANLLTAYDATIEGWVLALDLRDNETEGHSQRVTALTVQLARLAGIPEEEMAHVRRGALLHDVGKLGIPDAVLLKPGKLDDDEWKIMRRHPQYAYDMLWPIEYLRPAVEIPYAHHEKWDGTGYPRGLRGEEIPIGARLFSVVDVWDALRSDRPYRAGWPRERVIDHMSGLAGTHFDPRAIEMFFSMMRVEATA